MFATPRLSNVPRIARSGSNDIELLLKLFLGVHVAYCSELCANWRLGDAETVSAKSSGDGIRIGFRRVQFRLQGFLGKLIREVPVIKQQLEGQGSAQNAVELFAQPTDCSKASAQETLVHPHIMHRLPMS